MPENQEIRYRVGMTLTEALDCATNSETTVRYLARRAWGVSGQPHGPLSAEDAAATDWIVARNKKELQAAYRYSVRMFRPTALEGNEDL